MFASLAADYPREPRAGEPDRLGVADRQLADNAIEAEAHLAVMRDVIKVVVDEQELSGLAMLCHGDVAHSDRLAPLVEGLGGASSAHSVRLPDGAEAQAARFDQPPRWQAPITVEAWRWADHCTDQLVKQVLIGPYTLARLAEEGPISRESLALGLAEAMNQELRALVEADCPYIQIDEGALAAIGDDDDEWRLYAETERRLTAGLEARHLSLGLYRGAIHPAGHESIVAGAYRSYLVDAFGGPDAWRFVLAVPPERGIVIGALDAANPLRDDPELMVWAMAWAGHADRSTDRIGIAANGSLRSIGRHAARRKIEQMGEAVGIARMGPLQEVAEALDPDPLRSKMAHLRAMAEAMEAARASR